MAAEVPRILVTSERSGSCKRRSDLRVTEDTPGAQKSVAKRSGSPLAFSAVDDRGKESLRGSVHYDEAVQLLDSQGQVISQLMGNSTKILSQIGSVSSVGGSSVSQEGGMLTMEGVSAHIQALRGELQSLTAQLHSSSPDSTHLLLDLERLMHKNAELCSALAATQHSRTILEREVLTLKRSLHSERCEVTSSSAQSHTLMEENHRLLEENTRLKTQCTTQSHELIEENHRLLEDNTRMKTQYEQIKLHKSKELERCQKEIEQLRRSQLQEIDVRCREVDTLKEQLTNQLRALQQESDELSQQVSDLSAERVTLLHRMEELESQLQDATDRSSKDQTTLEQDKQVLQGRIGNLAQLVQELTKENSTLKSEISCLEKDCEELRTCRETLGKTVEEKTSMVVSAIAELETLRTTGTADKHQVEELKKELKEIKGHLRSQCDLASELKLLVEQRASRIQHLERLLYRRSNINGSLVDSAARQLPMATKNFRHLVGALSETQQMKQQLEVEVTQLRTNHAKLTGSYHAMVAIRDRQGQDNAHLSASNKELETRNKVLVGDKQFLLSKLEELSAECLHLANCEGAVKGELLKVCERRDQDMEDLTQELESLQLNNLQLQATANQVNHLKGELSLLEGVVDVEVDNLLQVAADYERDTQQDRHQIADLTEEEHVCAHGNEARSADVQACETAVTSLRGELEVLQARKTALLSMTSSVAVTTTISNTSRASKSMDGALCHHSNLKKKVKLLKKRNDFLRVRLGYALAELRVYQRQKLFTDQQLTDMQEGLDTVQRQYGRCAYHLDHMQQQI